MIKSIGQCAILAAVFFCFGFGQFSTALMAQCNPIAFEIGGNGIDEDCDGLDGHSLHLPKYLYMVEGKPFELFFRNIALSEHPQDYVYQVISPLNGQNANGKWTCTPTQPDVGIKPLTVQIKHPTTGQVLATATTQVRVSAALSPANASAKKVVFMGHSMVDQGIFPYYLRLLCEEAGNPPISFHGKRTSWIDNVTKHEGKGGASWRFFYADAQSPFRYGNAINFRQYFDETIGQNANPDVFIIHLGGNDYCFQGQLAGQTIPQIEAFIDADFQQNVLPFIQALRQAAPNTKIGISFEIPGNGRPNVFPNFFGTTSILGSHYRWRKIVNTILWKYSQYFENREQENIYLLPIHTGVDDVNHFADGDPVHPFPQGSGLNDPNGYTSMSKTVYAWIKHLINAAPSGGGQGTIDLELSMAATPQNPPIYSEFSATITIINKGPQAATNVQVSVPQPSGVTLVAPVFTASQGTFAWYSSKIWSVGTIPPNGSATLILHYYSLTSQPIRLYAEVKSVVQTDIDSSPNNGNGTTANEDDEAVFTTQSGGGGNTCDLELTLVGDAAQANAFSNFSTLLTLKNTSSVAAQNVRVHLPRPALCAYQGGNEGLASTGSFSVLNDAWEIANLPANTTATLRVNYFTLTNEHLDFYAEVEQASPADTDSSPNNGNGTTSNEDDEAIFSLNSANSCGLQANVFDVLCNNNGINQNPNDDAFTFKINVSGIDAGWAVFFNGQQRTAGKNETLQLGPFPIAAGPISLVVKKANDPNCSIDATVSPPQPCSNSNGINCSSQSDFPWHEWMDQVRIGNFTKNSDKKGYNDFTNDIIPLQRGQQTTCSVRARYSYFTYSEYVKIWIDYNQNSIFEEPSELAFSGVINAPANGNNAQATLNGQLQIPATAALGNARMRLSMKRGAYPTDCGAFSFGEVEDYTVQISSNGMANGGNFLREGTAQTAEQGGALIYPNPCRTEAFVSLKNFKNQSVLLRLVNGFGVVLWEQRIEAVESDALALPVADLPMGRYVLQCIVEGQRALVGSVVVQE